MKTNSTTGQRHAAQFGVFDITGKWEKARQSVHGLLLAKERIASLKKLLPEWHFNKYGNDGAVACFPPVSPCADVFNELSNIAPISSVCGPFYVVTHFVHP